MYRSNRKRRVYSGASVTRQLRTFHETLCAGLVPEVTRSIFPTGGVRPDGGKTADMRCDLPLARPKAAKNDPRPVLRPPIRPQTATTGTAWALIRGIPD